LILMQYGLLGEDVVVEILMFVLIVMVVLLIEYKVPNNYTRKIDRKGSIAIFMT